MNWLIIGDLHLTDKAADAYRFDIFKWAEEQQVKHNITHTFLLGDLTERKDRHSSTLVNKIVDGLRILRTPVIVVRGNHDGLDPESPFFKFINHIEGVRFVLRPTACYFEGVKTAIIPHYRTQEEFDGACGILVKGDTVLLHNTFDGALAESGARLSGLNMLALAAKCPGRVWAGDVHKPQRQGIVTYVGAPYTVRFGDDFTPRCLLVKDGKEQNLYFPSPRKWSLRVSGKDDILDNEDLYEGDQVKLTIELGRAEAVDWHKHKQSILDACAKCGLEVYGADVHITGAEQGQERTAVKTVTPVDAVNSFCDLEKAPDSIREAGVELVEDKGR